MKRRNFLKNISKASLAPLFLNGVPIREMGQQGAMQQLAAMSDHDRVLVLIQLHGGNDGLNTLIPLNQYSQYNALRSNIAIPRQGSRKYLDLKGASADNQQIGLHPDMGAFRNMFDQGKASIVQGVGYHHMNGSHFRSRDIWFMGGDYQDELSSGWCGRYLDKVFPDYPAAYPSSDMPDPLALEMGTRSSLAFHQDDGVSTAMNIQDPQRYYDLVSAVEGGGSTYGEKGYYQDELSHIMGIEQRSNDYAGRLQRVFDLGRNTQPYPEKYHLRAPGGFSTNKLSLQLKTIARLLSGGCRTKIFLARIDGFDTHAQQVEGSDPTMGSHAALLYNLFSAIEAFQKDIKALGMEDRVLTLTFSEFGRRPASNGSRGTDHGTAAPMFVFGKHVKPGVVGKNPSLTNLDQSGNLKHEYDYRQVFGSILEDWMLASPGAIRAARFSRYVDADHKLNLIAGSQPEGSPAPAPSPTPSAPEETDILTGGHEFHSLHPNPATDYIRAKYRMASRTPHRIIITSNSGQQVKVINRRGWDYGDKEATFDLSQQKPGIYFCTLEVGREKVVKQFIKR